MGGDREMRERREGGLVWITFQGFPGLLHYCIGYLGSWLDCRDVVLCWRPDPHILYWAPACG